MPGCRNATYFLRRFSPHSTSTIPKFLPDSSSAVFNNIFIIQAHYSTDHSHSRRIGTSQRLTDHHHDPRPSQNTSI